MIASLLTVAGGRSGECDWEVKKVGACSAKTGERFSPRGGCEHRDYGQLCAEIPKVPGILVASTCGDRGSDAGSEAPTLCSPNYDVANLSGVKTCVPVESVADGEGCDLATSGNESCMSGFCVGADVLGVLELGVCNPCGADTDCAAMETCAPPTVDLMAGLVVGGCVPA